VLDERALRCVRGIITMHIQLFACLATLLGFTTVNAIPIHPQQALLDIQYGQTDLNQLRADIVQNNIKAAHVDYATVQHQLDNLGFYLGQITDSTCVATDPETTTSPAVTQLGVLKVLQEVQMGLIRVTAGIVNSDKTAAISAWQDAQSSLENTHEYIFG
jgi:hypothetical protein